MNVIYLNRSLGLVLAVRLAFASRKGTHKQSKSNAVSAEVNASDGENHSPGDGVLKNQKKREVVLTYINTVFPPVYDTKRSVWSSMRDEVVRYNPYITIFNVSDKAAQETKMQAAIYLLTVQSMSMFLMAVLIDLEVRIAG